MCVVTDQRAAVAGVFDRAAETYDQCSSSRRTTLCSRRWLCSSFPTHLPGCGPTVRWSWLKDVFPTRDPRATTTNGDEASSPFDSDESLHELLTEAGFVHARSRTLQHLVRFADPDQWVTWSWSHGMRMFWERLPEDRRPEARDRVDEELRRMQAEPEGLALHMVVRYTTARAPG